MAIAINYDRLPAKSRIVVVFTRPSNPEAPTDKKVWDGEISGLSILRGPKLTYFRGDVIEAPEHPEFKGAAINLGFNHTGGNAALTDAAFLELRQAIGEYFKHVPIPHVGVELEGLFNLAPGQDDGPGTVFGSHVVVLEIFQALPNARPTPAQVLKPAGQVMSPAAIDNLFNPSRPAVITNGNR